MFWDGLNPSRHRNAAFSANAHCAAYDKCALARSSSRTVRRKAAVSFFLRARDAAADSRFRRNRADVRLFSSFAESSREDSSEDFRVTHVASRVLSRAEASAPPRVVSVSSSVLRRFAARGERGGSSKRSRKNDASSRSGEAHRGASGATPGSVDASSHAQMPDRSRSASSISRSRSGKSSGSSRGRLGASSRLPRMNARSVGSASHADAVDADISNATGDGKRGSRSSASSRASAGGGRTRARALKW